LAFRGFQFASIKYCLFPKLSVINSSVQSGFQIQIEYTLTLTSLTYFIAIFGSIPTFASQSVINTIILSLLFSNPFHLSQSVATINQSHIAVQDSHGISCFILSVVIVLIYFITHS